MHRRSISYTSSSFCSKDFEKKYLKQFLHKENVKLLLYDFLIQRLLNKCKL